MSDKWDTLSTAEQEALYSKLSEAEKRHGGVLDYSDIGKNDWVYIIDAERYEMESPDYRNPWRRKPRSHHE